MAIPSGYELATDAQFREVSNFTTPPRAGLVTAIEGNGQVRVDTDDPDGGDVLAWPLNGFTYAVNDVVYVIFAVNNPDSAIVIGSLAPLPTLEVGSPLIAEMIRARDGDGLRLEDDAGNLGIFIEDGGDVGINTASPQADLDVGGVQINSLPLSSTGTFNRHFIAATNSYQKFFEAFSAYNNGYFRFMFPTDNDKRADMSVNASGFGITAFDDGPVNALPIIIGCKEYLIRTRATGDPGSSTYDRLFLSSVGNFGLGTITPQGRLHAHDGTGGTLFVTKTAIDGTAQTIIPDGTGDVVRGMFFLSVVMPSSGSVFMTSNAIANSSNTDIYNNAGNILNLRVNANGSVDVRRTGGSLTYTLALFMVWL